MSARTAPIAQSFWTKHNSERAQRRIAQAEEVWTPDSAPWCAVCGATLNPATAWTVHIVNGGGDALHPADEGTYAPDGGDMGCWDLGPECARLVPQEYRTRHAGVTAYGHVSR